MDLVEHRLKISYYKYVRGLKETMSKKLKYVNDVSLCNEYE